jgi:type IV pilus assembly protein PilA
MKQQGFTLIELMIVTAIIGILASIAVPAYQGYVARSQFTEVFSLLNGYKNDMHEFYSAGGSCAGAQQYISQNAIESHFIDQVTVEAAGSDCSLVFQFKTTQVAAGLQGKHVSFTMHGTSYSWECESLDISQRYLPATCQGV